ncbi:MAG: hypothetical protein LRY50_13975 [Geovibrio sp.]|nr:hypothetical protein [Geovibrio sp.]
MSAVIQIAEARTLGEIEQRMEKIRELKTIMENGIHYGTIAGSPKPCLFKAGAESLLVMFRLCPLYELIDVKKDIENNFISYVTRCSLVYMGDEKKVATGMGSCNNFEKKYRYKWIQDDKPSEKDLLRMKAEGTGKFLEVWENNKKVKRWHKRVVSNESCFELDNTLLKMSNKRALVAAVLNATGASAIFTQDLEDSEDPPVHNHGRAAEHAKKEHSSPTVPVEAPKKTIENITPEALRKTLSSIKGLSIEEEQGFMRVSGSTWKNKDILLGLGFKYVDKKGYLKKIA